jgi:hypothetical protein
MSTIEYQEVVFNDTSMFGDNTNRVDDIMAVPTVGVSSIVRYKVPVESKSNVQCMAVNCDFGALILSGAYMTAQAGARLNVRLNGVVKFEQQFNWTGLSGYIGGADDYNSEGEVILSCYNMACDAGSVIDLYVTGMTNVRRIINSELYGVLDDGTKVRVGIKQAVDDTVATAIPLYTVPAGRILTLNQLVITTRHIDIYSGKGYMTYNGLPVMAFDIGQTEIGGMYGLVFPFYNLPLKESASIGFRMDNYECGNESVSGVVYASELPVVDPAEVAAAVWARVGRTTT